MPKSSQKKGGAKKEYTGTYRHFTLHEVNGKEVEIGTADIKDHQTPLNAAKKLLSSYCRHEGIKSNERNKVNITFTIRETTRGHAKIYGPYKGKFVKYDKPLMIKLKSGKVIKRTVKPMVSLKKNKNNSKMVGGQSNSLITGYELKEYVGAIRDLVNDKFNHYKKEFVTNLGKKAPYTTNKEKATYLYNNYGKQYGYLSKVDVSNVENMEELFKNFDFEGAYKMFGKDKIDIKLWFNKPGSGNKIESMANMFLRSNFAGPLYWWYVNYKCNVEGIFDGCENVYELTNETYSTKSNDKIWKLKDNIQINFYNSETKKVWQYVAYWRGTEKSDKCPVSLTNGKPDDSSKIKTWEKDRAVTVNRSSCFR